MGGSLERHQKIQTGDTTGVVAILISPAAQLFIECRFMTDAMLHANGRM